MAKPNYSFEKRQRDIAKKKKKEEKRQRKAGTEPETEETTSTEQSEAIKNIVWPTQDKTE